MTRERTMQTNGPNVSPPIAVWSRVRARDLARVRARDLARPPARLARKLGSVRVLWLAAVLLVIGPANVGLVNLGLAAGSHSARFVASRVSPALDGPTLDKKFPTPAKDDLAGCLQKCFDKYLSNVDRCKKAFCSYLFGVILLGCENERLAHCEGEAEGIYEACKDSCQSQPSH